MKKADVAILSDSGLQMVVGAFEAEGYQPAGTKDATVYLLVGKAKVEEVLGKDWIKEVVCTRKYKNQRAAQRAAWEPYCVRKADKWIVTCVHPDKVRKSRWALYPSLRAAVRHALWLAEGGDVFRLPSVLTRPSEWNGRK